MHMKNKKGQPLTFEEIVQQRYATKKFDGRKLPEEKVKRLLHLIRHAPSSYNLQPWKIIIVTEKKLKEKLLPAAWHQPQITSSSHLLVFCANKNILDHIDKLEQQMLQHGADKEKMRGSLQMMRDFEKGLTEEQKLSWAQRQTYLALGNAVNGAKSLGFDSCPMEGFDPKAYAELLQLPQNLVPSALCAIGYAIDTPRKKLRFPDEEIFMEK